MHRPATLLLTLLLAACSGSDTPDNAAFDAAYSSHRAAEVTVQAKVLDLRPDSPNLGDGVHQRFDTDVDGIRVEIDHNVSLASRVPVRAGDTVTIHGQFEPDPGHPVIHYTHHQTGRHEGGWIELAGQRYE
jgi:hypothetical protein